MTQTQAAPTIPKPLPRYPKDDAPYWEYLGKHDMRIQKCAECGKRRMYPRPMCDACYSMDVEWVPVSGKGRVYSWCIVHQPVHPAFKDELPFNIAEIELEEGVRIRSTVIDAAPHELYVGMPVELLYDDVAQGVTLPKFRKATS